jgi:hypothetical protein
LNGVRSVEENLKSGAPGVFFERVQGRRRAFFLPDKRKGRHPFLKGRVLAVPPEVPRRPIKVARGGVDHLIINKRGATSRREKKEGKRPE